MELPLWLADGNNAVLSADVSRAVAAGLRFRPVEETVRDTLQWARATADTAAALSSGMEIGAAGMEPERERELLAAWRAAVA
jgi:2'-hydroxyisoflavone reductase